MNIIHSITQAIGNTPIMALDRFSQTCGLATPIYGKLEFLNPCGSVKDRVGYALIEDGEKRGLLQPGATIIEPTSGNTGIGLAFCAVSKGYHTILTMPDTMSVERRSLLEALGAQLVLTPGEKGMQGAIDKAEELHREIPGSYIPGQFTNPANVQVHRETTAQEILRDFTSPIDFFVAGIGSGGTITGVGEMLKERDSRTQIVGVEPEQSAVLSGGKPGPHPLQGIGAGFIPSILNVALLDRVIPISGDEAEECVRQLAKTEGFLVGISAGAALAACVKVGRENPNSTILTILPDTGQRYITMGLFQEK